MKHLNIRIAGNVQGVGFRWWCWKTASSLGLTGFFKNDEDGTVSIQIEGENPDVDSFLELCKTGPAGAKVQVVTAEADTWRGYSLFEIRFR